MERKKRNETVRKRNALEMKIADGKLFSVTNKKYVAIYMKCIIEM